MIFDSTIGGALATSYISLTMLDDYFVNTSYSLNWDEDEKQTRLMEATWRLEQEDYLGSRLTISQALKWPRIGLFDWNELPIYTNAIPKQLIAATCELAAAYELKVIPSPMSGLSISNIQSISLFDISVTTKGEPMTGLPPTVLRLLANLIQTGDGTVRLIRS